MIFEQYKMIKDVYLDFYPDDRIDIQINREILQEAFDREAKGESISKEDLEEIDLMGIDTMSIIIYYPELTLTNDFGRTHTIYDVYLRIDIPDFHIYLGRTSYTQEEVKLGYIHSHVSVAEFYNMNSFCMGIETPILKIKDSLSIARKDHLIGNSFKYLVQSFIIETERMIRVESNAGGPYISFDTVKQNSGYNKQPITVDKDNYMPLLDYASSILKKAQDLIKYYCSLGLDTFYYDGRCWQLKATDAEFIKRVTKVAKTYNKTQKANIYQEVYTLNGLYYRKTVSNYSLIVNRTPSWHFKSQYPKYKILDSKVPYVSDKIVNIDIINALYWFLMQLVNTAYANTELYKDNFYSRACKIKNKLFACLGIED